MAMKKQWQVMSWLDQHREFVEQNASTDVAEKCGEALGKYVSPWTIRSCCEAVGVQFNKERGKKAAARLQAGLARKYSSNGQDVSVMQKDIDLLSYRVDRLYRELGLSYNEKTGQADKVTSVKKPGG